MTLPAPIRLENSRLRFLNAVRQICGNTARVILLPDSRDGTAILDSSGLGHTFTQNASVAGRMTRQGQGWLWTLNGTDQYADTPDAADLSFGDGTTDQPMSVVFFGNVTDSAAQRVILAKYSAAANVNEYAFGIDSTDHLFLLIRDGSAGVGCQRTSDAVITQGSPVILGASYSGVGGATAGNGITLYQNGVLIASTAANNAGYVAMENTAAVLELGTIVDHATQWLGGQAGLLLLCRATLTAAQHAALAAECQRYYGLEIKDPYRWDLVSHWKLDETSGTRADSLGANPLTDNNTVLFAAGKIGNAADFEAGNSEWLSCVNTATFPSGDVSFTAQAWVNLESKATDQAIIGQWGTLVDASANGIMWLLYYDTSSDRFSLLTWAPTGGIVTVLADNLGAVSLATWYCVHVWHDSVANVIGIAGNAGTPNTVANTNGLSVSTVPFQMGRSGTSSPTNHLDGLVDEVAIWTPRVLTSAERTALYNGGAGLAIFP